jgi:hypothetical protein
MSITGTNSLKDEITEFLAGAPSAEEIIAFRLSETLKARALELLKRDRENNLTQAELAEMEEFLKLNHFINMIKLKAGLKLAGDK